MLQRPETRYATTQDGVELAYQSFGSGVRDLVWLPHFLFGLDLWWDCPPIAGWLESLGGIGQVLIHDVRGTGLSDRSVEPADVGTDVADLIDVMDAAGVERAVLVGNIRGAAHAIMAAAVHPDRVSALVLWMPRVRATATPEYPWATPLERIEPAVEEMASRWGTHAIGTEMATAEGPVGAVDLSFQEWTARMARSAVTPVRARALWHRLYETDVRDILPAVHVPTLVLGREDAISGEELEWVRSRIDGATARMLPGADWMPWFGDLDSVLDAIRSFLGVVHGPSAGDRFLATVMFTDIVGSTDLASEAGDRAWRRSADLHHHLVRERLARFGGREQDTAGDGFFAVFDTPADAIRCGRAITEATSAVGLHVRAGIHVGECHLVDGKVGGVAVSIGARVAALAAADEVLVTSTIKDLVIGSGFVLEGAGEHELKGVPDRWRLYRVVG